MDFSQFTKRILPDELHDHITTWAACKIVSQRYVLHIAHTATLNLIRRPCSNVLLGLLLGMDNH
jgi:hypothetical protein